MLAGTKLGAPDIYIVPLKLTHINYIMHMSRIKNTIIVHKLLSKESSETANSIHSYIVHNHGIESHLCKWDTQSNNQCEI